MIVQCTCKTDLHNDNRHFSDDFTIALIPRIDQPVYSTLHPIATFYIADKTAMTLGTLLKTGKNGTIYFKCAGPSSTATACSSPECNNTTTTTTTTTRDRAMADVLNNHDTGHISLKKGTTPARFMATAS